MASYPVFDWVAAGNEPASTEKSRLGCQRMAKQRCGLVLAAQVSADFGRCLALESASL